MEPNNQPQASVDGQYRVLLVLWFSFLSTIGIYFLISQFIQADVATAPNKILTVALSAVGTFLVLVSFAVKQKFLKQSVETQQVALVQKGLIIAIAMCEAGALFALLDLLVTGNRYYFVVLIVVALGILLHFPRRDHLLAATYKNRLN